jgi:hypothetical protein
MLKSSQLKRDKNLVNSFHVPIRQVILPSAVGGAGVAGHVREMASVEWMETVVLERPE